jgi:hypothetical protein
VFHDGGGGVQMQLPNRALRLWLMVSHPCIELGQTASA